MLQEEIVGIPPVRRGEEEKRRKEKRKKGEYPSEYEKVCLPEIVKVPCPVRFLRPLNYALIA